MGRKEELDDLIAAFGRRMQEEHPNPERVGCPRKPALTTLATTQKLSDSTPSSIMSGSVPPAWMNSGLSGSRVSGRNNR